MYTRNKRIKASETCYANTLCTICTEEKDRERERANERERERGSMTLHKWTKSSNAFEIFERFAHSSYA